MPLTARALPGGEARRYYPAGVEAGAPLSRISAPADALALVGEELAEAELQLRELIRSDVAAVPAVAGYLNDAGGKRLRPALTALGARASGVGASSRTSLARLMCVGELIHLGSLLHDDVVDDGESRRGRPATHRVYGSAVSVLTGDFCLARAVLLAAEEGGHAAVTALAAAVTEMAEGEVLQLQRIGDLGCDVPGYLDVIDRKSAALIGWCASAGALASGDLESADALRRFGRGVGRAFQITDDVLDFASGTGKTLGADLREGKVTLPLIYAMERVDGLREQLASEPGPEAIERLAAQITRCGATEAALGDAHRFVDEALDALDALPAGPGRDALAVLGRYLVARTR